MNIPPKSYIHLSFGRLMTDNGRIGRGGDGRTVAVGGNPMNEQTNEPRPSKHSAYRIGFTLFLVVLSALFAVGVYPQRPWLLGASLGTVAIITVFLRVGWTISCMIAGTYVGFFLDLGIKSGDHESQMMETASLIIMGTVVGLIVGLFIEFSWNGREEDR